MSKTDLAEICWPITSISLSHPYRPRLKTFRQCHSAHGVHFYFTFSLSNLSAMLYFNDEQLKKRLSERPSRALAVRNPGKKTGGENLLNLVPVLIFFFKLERGKRDIDGQLDEEKN